MKKYPHILVAALLAVVLSSCCSPCQTGRCPDRKTAVASEPGCLTCCGSAKKQIKTVKETVVTETRTETCACRKAPSVPVKVAPQPKNPVRAEEKKVVAAPAPAPIPLVEPSTPKADSVYRVREETWYPCGKPAQINLKIMDTRFVKPAS